MGGVHLNGRQLAGVGALLGTALVAALGYTGRLPFTSATAAVSAPAELTTRVAVLESRYDEIARRLGTIETKLDRALERRERAWAP